MANLIVSNICNLNCSYCFAREYIGTAKHDSNLNFIPLDSFENHLDFLDRSGIEQVRIIGGEPTLHPEFPELLRAALLREKKIVIFSHGLIPEPALASIESISPENCSVLVNMNASRNGEGLDEREMVIQRDVIKRLGPRALLGYNIYLTNFCLDELLQLIEQAGCQKAIRLGLSHPTLTDKNSFLHPKQYPFVGQKIIAFASVAAEAGIRLEFDCGFVRCMFSDEGIDILRSTGADFGWRCNPILDIGINGKALHCFPLANQIQESINDGWDASGLRESMEAQTDPYRVAGIYPECSSCFVKERGECTGGCLAGTIRRFNHIPFRFSMPAMHHS